MPSTTRAWSGPELTLAAILTGAAAIAASLVFAITHSMAGTAAVGVLGVLIMVLVITRVRGHARRVRHDIEALTAMLGELTRGESFSVLPRAPVISRLATRSAQDFARRVDELRRGYHELARSESNARRAVEDAQRLKNRFMAYMSHDLKSPLNSILGFTEVLALETDGPLNPQQLENVEIIRSSGEELLRLVTDIIDSARLDAGRLRLHIEWTPSVTILNQAVARFAAAARYKGVEIEREIQPGLPPLYVDAGRIAQALSGLIGFMLRFMQQGILMVRARVSHDEEELWIEVAESESGIRAEDVPRIRDIVDSSQRDSGRPVGGLGLSLKLARELVARHQGTVSYESESSPTFRIRLPLRGPE